MLFGEKAGHFPVIYGEKTAEFPLIYLKQGPSSPRVVTDARLTEDLSMRSGFSNARASSGWLQPISLARWMVASSLETVIVGCATRLRSSFSASASLPSAEYTLARESIAMEAYSLGAESTTSLYMRS